MILLHHNEGKIVNYFTEHSGEKNFALRHATQTLFLSENSQPQDGIQQLDFNKHNCAYSSVKHLVFVTTIGYFFLSCYPKNSHVRKTKKAKSSSNRQEQIKEG